MTKNAKPSSEKALAPPTDSAETRREAQFTADLPIARPSPSAGMMDRSRAAWELGDWAALVALTRRDLEGYGVGREKLALLAAVGLAQSGQLDEAKIYIQMARDWGCSIKLIARFLAGGALNSLGRATSLMDDAKNARRYFEDSIAISDPWAAAPLLGRARDINEKIALGLLPEAASLMNQDLAQMEAQQSVSTVETEIFRTQVELINVVLAQAQKKGQLNSVRSGSTDQEALQHRSSSQLGQDLWVLEQTEYKIGGFFVEFGATDGVLLSNTLLLETDFAWNGICAEPNPAFFRKLRRNRSCVVAPDCIMGQSGRTVEFILADEYGGIAEFADSDQHAQRRAAFRENDNVVTLQSISLDDFLKKCDAPRTIDYLSIDTEGSEYDILSSFPFEEWDVRLVTVEHNFTPMRQKIRSLMERHGYVCTEMQWDDWYAKPVAE